MKLAEVVQSSESLIEGAIVFVDISDSTQMKEKETEATWITNYVLFFDIVRKHIKETGGSLVKYLGDGIMAFYDMNSVVNAINAAILIQEEVNESSRDRLFAVSCTIGIAEGKMRMFQTENDTTDYIGNVVDRAARLGSVASPKAIFVDTSTINSAAMNQVTSKRGKLANWSVDDYIGEQQKIILKGFKQSVSYFEVKWDTQAYGVKSQYTTDSLEKEPIQNSVQTQEKINKRQYAEKKIGTVAAWKNDIMCGFITEDISKKSYYTNTKYTIDNIAIPEGAKVYFTEGMPLKAGASPLAMAVSVVNTTYTGTIKHINNRDMTKQLSNIILTDDANNSIDIFAFLGNNQEQIQLGDKVQFVLSIHHKGPIATNIVRLPN